MRTNIDTPSRALLFLHGVAKSASARSVLSLYGYTAAEHERGWALLRAATGNATVVDCTCELECFAEGAMRRGAAALLHHFPCDAVRVFGGLPRPRGAAAVVAVEQFFDRIDALDADPRALLAARGLTPELAQLMRSRIAAAKAVTADARAAASQEARLALHAWFEDWSETARSVLTTRSALVRLGLASRRRPRAEPVSPTAPTEPRLPLAPAVAMLYAAVE